MVGTSAALFAVCESTINVLISEGMLHEKSVGDLQLGNINSLQYSFLIENVLVVSKTSYAKDTPHILWYTPVHC